MLSKPLQDFYIIIMNFIYSKYIEKIDSKVREAYLHFIFCLFELYFILFFSNEFKHILFTHGQRGIFGAALLFLAASFSMDRPLQHIRWRMRLFIPMAFGALGLIVTGLLHPIGSGYMSFGFILLLIYPCFYFVWNNRKDYETLFDIASKANLEIGMMFFIYCILIYGNDIFQTDRGRFQGPIKDPNLYSLIGMAMVCSAMYMIYRKRKDRYIPIVYIVAATIGFAIIVLGQSRSALMVGAGAMIITSIFSFKNSERVTRAFKKAMVFIVVLLICTNAPMVISNADSPGEGIATEESSFFERFSFKGKDLNTFTSGRADIWEKYAEKLNMTGNNFDETDWTVMTGDTVTHAHNNFLEYGYRCGIPVATMFILLELFAGLITLKYLFGRIWKRDAFLYATLYMFMYAVMSMLDIATIPMERYAPFTFYLLLTILIDTDDNYGDDGVHLI